MPQGQTLQVEGYQEFQRALTQADANSKKFVRETFRKVGERVKFDAQSSTSPVHSKTAAGFKTRVRQTGVVVEQSLRRTTGAHPEWGSWQMRHALLPALDANEESLMQDMDDAMDQVADHFNSAP